MSSSWPPLFAQVPCRHVGTAYPITELVAVSTHRPDAFKVAAATLCSPCLTLAQVQSDLQQSHAQEVLTHTVVQTLCDQVHPLQQPSSASSPSHMQSTGHQPQAQPNSAQRMMIVKEEALPPISAHSTAPIQCTLQCTPQILAARRACMCSVPL
jgi:hypothetical protein